MLKQGREWGVWRSPQQVQRNETDSDEKKIIIIFEVQREFKRGNREVVFVLPIFMGAGSEDSRQKDIIILVYTLTYMYTVTLRSPQYSPLSRAFIRWLSYSLTYADNLIYEGLVLNSHRGGYRRNWFASFLHNHFLPKEKAEGSGQRSGLYNWNHRVHILL